jgi:hypothetical protein
MQTITTKYIGPSATKNPRIKAWCDAGNITVPYEHALSEQNAHAVAAMALVRKLGWVSARGYNGFWMAGSLGKNNFVFVLDDAKNQYSEFFYLNLEKK